MLKQFVAGVVAVILVSAAVAGPLEDGSAAYDRGDYTTALRLWRPLAHQGDAPAQYKLGIMYAQGKGVPQDYAEAVIWYRLAAEQGLAPALRNLGVAYYKADGSRNWKI